MTIYGVRLIPLPAAAGRGRGEMGQGKVPIVVACAGVCGCVGFWLRGGRKFFLVGRVGGGLHCFHQGGGGWGRFGARRSLRFAGGLLVAFFVVGGIACQAMTLPICQGLGQAKVLPIQKGGAACEAGRQGREHEQGQLLLLLQKAWV